MADRSGLERAANAARLANGIKNIAKGFVSGGLQGAAIAAAKSYAPQLIKAAVIAAILLFLLPVIIISALPAVLFGWGTIPDTELKDRKVYAESMEDCYNKVAQYRQEVIVAIQAEHDGEGIIALEDDGGEIDPYWTIAVDGVKHRQDVYKLNEAEIKKLIRQSLEVSVRRVQAEEVVVIYMTITTIQPEALMEKLAYSAEEQNWARLLYNTATMSQVVSESASDYADDTVYTAIPAGSGDRALVYYNQMDDRWKNTLYGRAGTIGKEGCGPAALATVVSTLTGRMVNPVEAANWSAANGHRCVGVGSYHSLIPKGGAHYGLTVTDAGKKDRQKIIDALNSGKMVIALMNPGHFTTGGHFITLYGVTPAGKILVADPVSRSRSEKEWDLSLILNEARGDVSAGPFWILSLP
jgi:hypothetical protein